MKILRLTFMNLNSLYGRWEIDFTSEAYLSNGIFALTGPTGAGKSTILDAICLALYGQTPRLGKITTTNEIMSRNTGECFSEVVFRTQSGTYIAHWAQHRARKKPDGNLTDSTHEVSNAETKEILETKKKLVLQKVEELTGMDFSRFTRSILLAQGSFDSFLKANTDEKSKILEQITGVGIYSEISKLVFERQKEERQRLELLKAGLDDMTLLSQEEIDEKQAELVTKTQEEGHLSSSLDTIQAAITWLGGISQLKAELVQLAVDESLIDERVDAFKPERERLDAASRAAEVEGAFGVLEQLRRAQASEISRRDSLGLSLPKQKELKEEAQRKLNAAEAYLKQVNEEQEHLQKTLTTVRLIDQRIVSAAGTLEKHEQQLQEVSSQILEKQKEQEKNRESLAQITAEREDLRSYIEAHTADELLVSDYSAIEAELQGIRQQASDILVKRSQAAAIDTDIADLLRKRQGQQEAVDSLKSLEDEIGMRIAEENAKTESLLEGRLLREYRDEYTAKLKERSLIGTIINLEEERRRLVDAEPCPLCGSVEHPYAEGIDVSIDEVDERISFLEDRIAALEMVGEEMKILEGRQSRAKMDLDHAMNQLKELDHALGLAETKRDESIAAVRDTELENQNRCDTLLERLKPLGVAMIEPKKAEELSFLLKQRLERWKGSQSEDEGLRNRYSEIDHGNRLITEHLEHLVTRRAEVSDELLAVGEELAVRKKERRELFGEDDPDVKEQEMSDRLRKTAAAVDEAESGLQHFSDTVLSVTSQIDQLRDTIDARASQIRDHESAFLESLQDRGLESEELFLEKRLDAAQRRNLSEQAQALDRKQHEVQTQLRDRQGRLKEEEGKALTDKNLDELDPEKKLLEESLSLVREQMSRIRFELDEDRQNREKVKERQVQIELQDKVFTKWNTLNAYIGSSDGKKFRNYAQGLTFELMVSHANRQLQKMTDRYLLIRDGKAPLELNVIDNYQAGETRSIRNLSGGESFIVSLSLALGLSSMSSRKVKVDSLFLDEGFGTLDEDVLDTALEMLAGLHEEDKLIGIISHVPALKERIGIQIQVSPISGGKSTISGPGCQSMQV